MGVGVSGMRVGVGAGNVGIGVGVIGRGAGGVGVGTGVSGTPIGVSGNGVWVDPGVEVTEGVELGVLVGSEGVGIGDPVGSASEPVHAHNINTIAKMIGAQTMNRFILIE